MSVECSEYRQGLLVGERKGRDRGDLAFCWLAWCTRLGRISDCCWVTGCEAYCKVSGCSVMTKLTLLTQILHGTSLHRARMPRRALRIRLVPILFSDLTIISRVGIDHHAQHTKLLGPFHF
jgi:hypothetical protein